MEARCVVLYLLKMLPEFRRSGARLQRTDQARLEIGLGEIFQAGQLV